ncbi:MAG: hypothetical protein ACJ0GH_00080 [Alphaproteobacteria bacterium]
MKHLDLIILNADVFLPNETIDRIDIGIIDSKIVELCVIIQKGFKK